MLETIKEKELVKVEDILGNMANGNLEIAKVKLGNLLVKKEQVDCPVIHRFGPNIYIREVSIPKGVFAIGHYQKETHLNIFLKGKVTYLNDDGSTSLLEAPMIFTSPPGRKCGYIHEDVVWLNVYATDERDIEKLEAKFLDQSQINAEDISDIERRVDRSDYLEVLKKYGYTEKLVREQTENKADQIPFPDGGYKVSINESAIQGKGLFATAPIVEGEFIAPSRILDKRTPAGRYANHSINPNAEMVKAGNNINLIALKKIEGKKGGQKGEEITVNYRQVLDLQFRRQPCQE